MAECTAANSATQNWANHGLLQDQILGFRSAATPALKWSGLKRTTNPEWIG